MPSLVICSDCGKSVDRPASTRSRCPRCHAAYKAKYPDGQRTPEGLARRAAHRAIIGTRRWRRVAAEVKQRDGACIRCGTTRDLTVHHLMPARFAEDPFDPTNLVTLCRRCHAEVEADRRRRRRST